MKVSRHDSQRSLSFTPREALIVSIAGAAALAGCASEKGDTAPAEEICLPAGISISEDIGQTVEESAKITTAEASVCYGTNNGEATVVNSLGGNIPYVEINPADIQKAFDNNLVFNFDGSPASEVAAEALQSIANHLKAQEDLVTGGNEQGWAAIGNSGATVLNKGDKRPSEDS